jgi:hypothetical protein
MRVRLCAYAVFLFFLSLWVLCVQVDFSVPPIVATIMFHFEERSDWNLEQLSSVMKVSRSLPLA